MLPRALQDHVSSRAGSGPGRGASMVMDRGVGESNLGAKR